MVLFAHHRGVGLDDCLHADRLRAQIDVILDDQVFISWQGKQSDLSLSRWSVLEDHPKAIGLAAPNSGVIEFKKVTLTTWPEDKGG
jgi:hypothetical protein